MTHDQNSPGAPQDQSAQTRPPQSGHASDPTDVHQAIGQIMALTRGPQVRVARLSELLGQQGWRHPDEVWCSAAALQGRRQSRGAQGGAALLAAIGQALHQAHASGEALPGHRICRALRIEHDEFSALLRRVASGAATLSETQDLLGELGLGLCAQPAGGLNRSAP